MFEEIEKLAKSNGLEFKQKKDEITLNKVVAERKAFLSKKKLEYIAKIKVDEESKEVKFSEMLKESGSGLSSGGFDNDMSAGFGFKAGTYKTGVDGISGDIEEQSKLFGKDYSYDFKYEEIRNQVKALAEKLKYQYSYSVF